MLRRDLKMTDKLSDSNIDNNTMKEEMLKICLNQDGNLSKKLLISILDVEEKFYGNEKQRLNVLWDIIEKNTESD
jgi:hypothetical protein